MCHGCNGPRVLSTRVTGAEAPSVVSVRVVRELTPGSLGYWPGAGTSVTWVIL